MASPPVSVYDFTSEENAKKWKGLLQPALSKVCIKSTCTCIYLFMQCFVHAHVLIYKHTACYIAFVLCIAVCCVQTVVKSSINMCMYHTHCLGQIQKQVHPRMDIEDDAISCMEELVYHLLSQICSTQPHSINDVKAYVAKNFVVPINTWAINDAQRTMERHQVRRGKSVFNFPVEKLYPLLEKV